jgi:two-component system, sensor histidine kinase
VSDTDRQPTSAPGVDVRVRVEQVSSPYDLTPLPVGGGIAFSLVLGSVVAPSAGPLLAWGWTAVMVVVSVIRILETRAFRRDAQRNHRIEHWARRYFFWMVLYGVTWGSIGVLFVPSGRATLDGVLLATVVAVAAVGVFTLLGLLGWCVVFLTAVLLPSLVHYVSIGTSDGLVAWVGMLVYWGLLVVECHRGGHMLIETRRLRHQNEWFAEQVQGALRQAEQSSAAKSRFVATVSHEMRTPLNGILGMVQLLQRDGASPAQQRPLALVAASARHLRAVIDDILDLSQVESGRLRIEIAPLDLPMMVREVCDTLEPLARDKGLALQLDLPANLPVHWMGDAARLRQVLINLVGNAVKFTLQGQVSLAVAAREGGLRFTVTDTGPGIPADAVQRVFEPFEQANSRAARHVGGTGLGLAIARRLSRAMDGDITCPHTGPDGSTFVFDVALQPAATAAGPNPADSPQPAANPAGAPAAAQPAARLLVVEDNPVNALVAIESLKCFGYDPVHVDSGEAALEALPGQTFDLVLMDCQMPGIDGFETTRRWRQREAADGLHRLPIIAVTANAAPEDRARCLAAGMDDYLTKPFELSALDSMVQRHLARHGRSR